MTITTLTIGNDNVVGTNNPDIIIGTTDTWQQADTISGGTSKYKDVLQITALSAAAGTIGDTMFQHVSNIEQLELLGKFAVNVTLGALSNAASIDEVKGIRSQLHRTELH